MDAEPKYPVAEVKQTAVQMYQEMLWALRTHQSVMQCAFLARKEWADSRERMETSFLQTFPDKDPQLAIEANQYILDHADEVARLASSKAAVIDTRLATEMGFGNRVKETLSGRDETALH